MSHVFISYSHEDADFVTKLDEICQDEHINTWVDKKRLKAGENWRDAIDEGIKNAFALIVVLSPHAVISPYVTYEWSFALGIGLEIIPVICRQIKFDDNPQKNREIENQLTSELEDLNHRFRLKIPKPSIHPRLDVFQYIDLSNEEDNSPKWQELIVQIKEKQQNFRPHSVNIPREAPKIVHDMVAKLDSIDGNERENAIINLSDIDNRYAEKALINALQHLFSDVRKRVAQNLGTKKSKNAIPTLTQMVQHELNESVRFSVVEALGKIGGEAVVPGLIQALQDTNKNICRISIEALGKIGSVESISSLIKSLDDEDNSIREKVFNILEKTFGEIAIPSLILALRDTTNSERVRQLIATILGNIGSSDAVPALIQCLPDDSLLIRRRVISALGEIGGSDAVPYLIKCLQDNEDIIRREAVLALGKIKSKDAIPSLIIALQDNSYHVRENASLALGEIGDPQTVSNLIKVLEDKKTSVRETAIIALSKIADEKAIQCLIQILGNQDNSQNDHMREFTIQILSNIVEEATPYLREAINHDNEAIKFGAMRVLSS